MGWLRLVGSLQLYVSSAKEPYQRDYILQKRPIILKSVLSEATPYAFSSDESCASHIIAEYSLFCRAVLQKRPIILKSLLIAAIP